MTQSTYHPSAAVRVLYASMIVGWLVFLGALLAGPFGFWGFVLPLGLVAVIAAGQALARRPWRMIVNTDMAHGFLALGGSGWPYRYSSCTSRR